MVVQKNITIYKNLYDLTPYYTDVKTALNRIARGNSRAQIEAIRGILDKDRQDALKRNLPSVCFAGKFDNTRTDKNIIEHSNFIVLDFDNLHDVREKQGNLINFDFIYACWVSPRGNGLKALVRLADGKKHREHFAALKDIFPDIDESGVNESRVCFESWDPDIYINEAAKAFTTIKKTEVIHSRQLDSESETFKKLLTWMVNRGNAFVKGERNFFVFRLASACCRFGISEEDAISLIRMELQYSATDFSDSEAVRTIRSAYKANKNRYGSAHFEKDVLVEKDTKKEIEFDDSIYDTSIKPKDVIYGEDVKAAALKIYKEGFAQVKGIGVTAIDERWKFKPGEISLLSGIGNYGKSTFLIWYLIMRALKYGEKYGIYTPESEPAEEFYHDATEILLGCNCTPSNPNRPNIDIYTKAYNFICDHFFFVYPKDVLPTQEYIKERFLELVIKEKISGSIIDPYNQLAHDYKSAGGRSDKYLEFSLADFSRFAKTNNQMFLIVAHPKMMAKDESGNYKCPDVFDIADGAMWNNKMDNILIYHRPDHQINPDNPLAELHSKKIRRQKSVGKKGFSDFEYHRNLRRYCFDGVDVMQRLLNELKMDFTPRQAELFDTSFNPEELSQLKPF